MTSERRTESNYFIELENHLLIQEGFVLTFKSKKPSKVIMTVPHDGPSWLNFNGLDLKEREGGFKKRDRRVWPITMDILNKLSPGASLQTSAMRGLMPRKYVDYNRSYPVAINYYPNTQNEAQTALENQIFVQAYDSYHHQIYGLVENAVDNNGKDKCLLFDLHGFGVQPPYAPSGGYDIILGTGNRTLIPHGEVDQKLGHYLTDLGYKVFVPEEKTEIDAHEEDLYAAGFTARHYSQKFNINAIQMEISSKFRDRTARKLLGPKLSSDLAAFLESQI